MKFLISFLIFLNILTLSAQETIKGELLSEHGGQIKKTSKATLELVHDSNKTKIYMKGYDSSKLGDHKLSLSAIMNVNGKKYPLDLTYQDDHYTVNSKMMNLHKDKNRVLMLEISFPGKSEQVQFNLK
jgi:hypothetical protein